MRGIDYLSLLSGAVTTALNPFVAGLWYMMSRYGECVSRAAILTGIGAFALFDTVIVFTKGPFRHRWDMADTYFWLGSMICYLAGVAVAYSIYAKRVARYEPRCPDPPPLKGASGTWVAPGKLPVSETPTAVDGSDNFRSAPSARAIELSNEALASASDAKSLPSCSDDMQPGHPEWVDWPIQWRHGETNEEFAARKLIPEEQELHRLWLIEHNKSQRNLRSKRSYESDMQELAEFRSARKKIEEDRAYEIRLEAWEREHPWQALKARFSDLHVTMPWIFVLVVAVLAFLSLLSK